MMNGKSRLQWAEEEVSEVKGIMMDNLKKADERADKLEDLDDRAEDMLAKSKSFEKTTQKVKQKKRWENMRTKMVLVGVGVAALLIVIGIIIYYIVRSTNGGE
ncbi:vesicle-associated membrane protein 5 [Gadus macrocephalus]|uniref:vesicle-associated membrane protein 5 n=1 Tax=Gadus macrocephalus TaxID=80720 RepID=UPI0028CB3E49|nr:vesicle-associated membrane protein 5 [Gadus macrocephalus]